MVDKIKVLFLAANPVDAGFRLRLDEEIREIGKKLRIGEFRDSFELVSEWAVRASDLQEALLRHRPHIVHFSGHGTRTEGIVLEDSAGNMKPVNKVALARLFELLKENIQVIVLNACYAEDQAKGLAQTIDYTIGMNHRIGDKAAIVFAAYFYQALAFGNSVTKAFELARLQLDLDEVPGSSVPELLIRDGLDQSRPFLKKSMTRVDKQSTQKRKRTGDGGNISVGGNVEGSILLTGNQHSVYVSHRGESEAPLESQSKRREIDDGDD